MSFAKADTLIELATLAASRRHGITLDDVTERFAVSHRTAQRMLHQMELTFPDAETRFDGEGRKRWTLATAALRDLLTLTPDELAALDHAAEALARGGETDQADALARLKDKILALVPRDRVRRLETDHEALLEAQGFVARPGPRPKADAGIAETLSEAIKACRVVEIVYSPRNRARTTSRVMPYGLLAGMRRYLVVKAEGRTEPSLRAIDRIVEARLTDETFTRDESFDLAAFAKRSFGAFQSPQEYGEVVWRFTPAAADHARDFIFHPDQQLTTEPDGALTVRFHAAGHLEMAWHLYMWGDKVEVLAPEALRTMVETVRRSDWPAMP